MKKYYFTPTTRKYKGYPIKFEESKNCLTKEEGGEEEGGEEKQKYYFASPSKNEKL